MKKHLTLSVLAVISVANSHDAFSQNVDGAGPMVVKKYRTLQRAAQNKENGFWAPVALQEYNNGLIEGLLDKEGQAFCLSKEMKTTHVVDVFRHLTIDISAAVRGAADSDFVSVRALNYLKQKYPC